MASEPELLRMSRDLDEVRRTATYLLTLYRVSLTEWEIDFLKSMTANDAGGPLSYRQTEKLLQIRNDYEEVSTYRGISIARILRDCWDARLDLEEDNAEFVDRLKAANKEQIVRRHLGRLVGCAIQLNLIEDYM